MTVVQAVQEDVQEDAKVAPTVAEVDAQVVRLAMEGVQVLQVKYISNCIFQKVILGRCFTRHRPIYAFENSFLEIIIAIL